MLDCSAGSPVEELSLAIPESAKIPNDARIIEMATVIAATLIDKRTVPTGCVDQGKFGLLTATALSSANGSAWVLQV
jgi:hypothetical protein